MKKTKKTLQCFALTLLISMSMVPLTSFAETKTVQTSEESRADIIEWRYKTEDGKLYRRKYNCSKQTWIGDWEFVANIS